MLRTHQEHTKTASGTGLARLISLALAVTGSLTAQTPFYFNPSERVLFYGGSAPLGQLETALIETYVATRFPRLNVEFAHRAWDDSLTASSVAEILNLKPTAVVLGLNPRNSGTAPEAGDLIGVYKELVHKLREKMPDIRIVVVPLAGFPPGAWRTWAQEERLLVYEPGAARSGASIAEGLLFSGSAFLRLWHAPGVVSEVEISAAAKLVLRSENTSVRNLEVDPKVVFWSQDDAALPLPAELTTVGGMPLEQLNVERVRVRGLLAGNYKFTIDGWTMGNFDSEAFERGIDLTRLPTPMLKQSSRVLQFTVQHIAAQRVRWELLSSGKAASPDWDKAESDALEQRAIAGEPLTHDYEIVPVQ
jgi:hypothetical protein